MRSLSFDQKHGGDLSQTPVYSENKIFSCEAKPNHAIVFGGTWKNCGLYLHVTYILYITVTKLNSHHSNLNQSFK